MPAWCQQGVKLHPDNLTISSGCGAIINNMIYCIAEAGDGIAIPGPYYPAFDYDLKVGIIMHKLTVKTHNPFSNALSNAAHIMSEFSYM